MPDDETLVSEVSASTVPGDERSCLALFVSRGEGTTVVTCRGDLDLTTQETLRDTLADVVRSKPDLVVVDVSQVAFFDCGAIGEFVRARAALRAFGSTLVLRSPTDIGRRVLGIAGVLDLISVGSGDDVQHGDAPSTSETVTSEVTMLSRAWRNACETHPKMGSALVFADPELVVSGILGALDSPPRPLDTSALAQTLPIAFSRDQPIGTLAASQLLTLWRLVRDWIGQNGPRRRRDDRENRLADVIDVAIVAVVSAAVATLERAALIDPLTGLLNRRALDRDLAQSLGAARRHRRALTVVVIDLDGLKGINDSFGHDAGDGALCALASSLSTAVRVGDNAYRIGGDEFVLLLPDLRPEDVHAVIDRTIVGAGAGFSWGSAGVSADSKLASDAETPTSLIALADSRMIEHRARQRGSAGDGEPGQEAAEASRFSGTAARLVGHLQDASSAHVLIEQAKGVVAEHFGLDIGTASAAINDFAQRCQQPVHRVAARLVDRSLSAAEFDLQRPVPDEPPSRVHSADASDGAGQARD